MKSKAHDEGAWLVGFFVGVIAAAWLCNAMVTFGPTSSSAWHFPWAVTVVCVGLYCVLFIAGAIHAWISPPDKKDAVPQKPLLPPRRP